MEAIELAVGIGFLVVYVVFELLTYLSKRKKEMKELKKLDEEIETLNAQEELAKKQKEKLDGNKA